VPGTDEFWTYAGNKKNKPGRRTKLTGITRSRIAADGWQSFITAFLQDTHDAGREFAAGIEGNNCTLRHRVRRVFRKTCCFSKKLRNHWKAFGMAFFRINYAFV
jgi:IS1 family transposase